MMTTAVVLEGPECLSLRGIALAKPEDGDCLIDVEWSGISTGTERLLFTGRMPPFPGLGYPLVPGYESVGRVRDAGGAAGLKDGDRVFIPGAKCFGDVRGLFGGAASRLVVPGHRLTKIDEALGEKGVLLALAATAHHACLAGPILPELVIGHGVLGRLIARTTVALGGARPTVWETNARRAEGSASYDITTPDSDGRRNYRAICDASGDSALLDTLIGRLAPLGVITLAGFYSAPLSFSFPPAFMREARISISAEWRDADLRTVTELIENGSLSLEGLITHRCAAADAPAAYQTAFTDPDCLKMILDWRACS